jgi:RNA polymerase sigma-70 factor (ECF subfamily)
LLFKKDKSFTADDQESILRACIKNDGAAQKVLIRQYYSFVMSISLRYSASREEAEEMLNDTFLKVFKNLGKYDFAQPFKAWLRRITVNTAIDYYRKNQKHSPPVGLDDVVIPDFSDDVISRISAEEILRLVQKLSPSYRMVFTLHVVEGYNHKEIAEMLGIQEGTSKSNLQDARRKLQQMIKAAYPQLHLAYGIKVNRMNEN